MDSWLLKSEKDLTAGGVQEQLAAGRVWAATTGPDVQGAAGNMDEKVLAAGGVGGLAAGRGKTCGRWVLGQQLAAGFLLLVGWLAASCCGWLLACNICGFIHQGWVPQWGPLKLKINQQRNKSV